SRCTTCSAKTAEAFRLVALAESAEGRIDFVAGALAALDALLLDLEVHLFAEDWDVPRGLDANPDLLTDDREHRHLNVVPDHDALVGLAGQYQHEVPPCSPDRVSAGSGPPASRTGGPDCPSLSIPARVATRQPPATIVARAFTRPLY